MINGCLDASWSPLNDLCFSVVQGSFTLEEAANACRSKGSDLTSIWSQQEWNFVRNLMVNEYKCIITEK